MDSTDTDAAAVVAGELGRLQLWIDGVEHPVRGARSQAVLALLLLRSTRGASMDYLVDHVWPDNPPTARRSLANIIRRLRGVLGDGTIVTDGATYRIDPGILSHRRNLLDAAAYASEGSSDPSTLVDLAASVEMHWRGDPWQGFDEIAPLIGDRTMLRDARIRLLEAAAGAARELHQHDAAARYLRLLVDERPHQERWWCELADLVASSGDRVAALRMLHSARAALDQVGLLPSAQLADLERELLGSPEPPLHVVEGDLSDRTANPTLRVAEELPFAGRSNELARLVDSAAAVPAASLALIEGPAGAGKSRLMVEAARRCRQHIVLSGRCAEGGRSALGPIRRILEEYVATTSAVDLAAEVDGFEAALRDQIPGLAIEAKNAGGTSLVDEHERLVHACVTVLLRASERRPLLLLIDDLQWASEIVLDVVQGLAHRVDPDRLAIMATCRFDRSTEPSEKWATATLVGPSRVHLLLGPLSSVDVQAIVSSAESTVDVDELMQRSGGNAFFVSELLNTDQGLVDGQSLLRLVRSRVDLVHHRASDFLTTAALCGMDFDTSLVGEAARLSSQAVAETVDALARNRLVLRESSSSTRCTFAHGLVAEAMISASDASELRQRHLRLAAAEQRLGSPANIWVDHLLEAGPLVDPHTIVVSAVEAAQQLTKSQPAGAAALMHRVLQLRLDSGDRVTVMTWLGRALLAIGEQGARAMLLQASELAIADKLDMALIDIALVYSQGGPWAVNSDPNGKRLLNLALERCPDSRADIRLRLEARLSSYEIFSGSLADRSEAAERAVEIARRSGDADALGDALNIGIVAISCPAALTKTRVLEDEIRQLEDAGLAFSEMGNRPAISTFWLARGDQFRADVELRRQRLVSATHRDRQTLNGLETVLAVFKGDLDRARKLLAAQVIDNDVERGNFVWNSVAIEWINGQVTDAFNVVESAYQDLAGAPLRYTLLWLAAEAGQETASRESLVRELYETITPRRVARLPELMLGGFGLGGLAMAAVVLQDRALVELVEPVLAPLAGQMLGVPWSSLPSADFFLAAMASVAGDRDSAHRYGEQARRVHERMGAPAFTDLLDRYVAS